MSKRKMGRYCTVSVTICSFNLDSFGKSKIEDDEKVNDLVKVVCKYDITAVQEIMEKDQGGEELSSILKLKDMVNKKSKFKYELKVSERTGDSKNQEQFGIFYRDREDIKVSSSYNEMNLKYY